MPGNVYSVDGSNLPDFRRPSREFQRASPKADNRAICSHCGETEHLQRRALCRHHPESQREGVLLSAHYGDAESVDLFSQVLYSHQHLQNQSQPHRYRSIRELSRLITLTIRLVKR